MRQFYFFIYNLYEIKSQKYYIQFGCSKLSFYFFIIFLYIKNSRQKKTLIGNSKFMGGYRGVFNIMKLFTTDLLRFGILI